MRLRVSGETTGNDYNLRAITEGRVEDMGLPQGDTMNALAEGVCNRDWEQTRAARKGIVESLGDAALVDAAAVIAAFNAYPRAADATGIPVEEAKLDATVGLRADLGLDALDMANVG